MAVTSSGDLLVNVAYAGDCRTVGEVSELLRDGRMAGTVFIGIVLDPARTKATFKRIDDTSAEIVATSGIRLRAGQRSQR